MKPLVILPTYNERANMETFIPAVLASDSRLHVLVVDDGSPDGTAAYVEEIIPRFNERLHIQKRQGKLGLGTAYIHGFKWGLAKGYDFLIEMDSDWSHLPRYIEDHLKFSERYDFTIGSRYVTGGGTKNWGFGRLLISKFGSLYSRLILGVPIRDFTGGFNGWNARVLQAIDLDSIQSEGYSFQIELKYRAARLGFSFKEFPIIFEERRAGASKMSSAIVREAIWRVWQIRALPIPKTALGSPGAAERSGQARIESPK